MANGPTSSYRTLLSGYGTGFPLFILWCMGAFAHFRVLIAVSSVLAYTVCILLISFWQSVLLLPSWWRRGLWVLFPLGFAITWDRHLTTNETMWKEACFTSIMQSLLLLRIRRRVVLWIVLAVVSCPLLSPLFHLSEKVYDLVLRQTASFRPFLLPRHDLVYDLMVGVAFGAIAAFLMPPVGARETKSAPKGI